MLDFCADSKSWFALDQNEESTETNSIYTIYMYEYAAITTGQLILD